MEDVNVLSQRCVDETTSTTTQVGSHFFAGRWWFHGPMKWTCC